MERIQICTSNRRNVCTMECKMLSLTLCNLHSSIVSNASTCWWLLSEEQPPHIKGTWLILSTAYLKLIYWTGIGKAKKKKKLPLLLSREGCLGICSLMFRDIAEGFTKCALCFLPSKAPSDSSQAATNMIIRLLRFYYWISDELQ